MPTETNRKNKLIPSTRILLLGIWNKLSLRRRLQLAVVIIVMLLSGAAELISLGVVLPFLAVISEPEQLNQPLLKNLAYRVGVFEANNLLLPITIAFVITVIMASTVRLLNLWLNLRLAAAVGSDLSCEAYKRTLYQPYEVHLRQNSSSVITAATVRLD